MLSPWLAASMQGGSVTASQAFQVSRLTRFLHQHPRSASAGAFSHMDKASTAHLDGSHQLLTALATSCSALRGTKHELLQPCLLAIPAASSQGGVGRHASVQSQAFHVLSWQGSGIVMGGGVLHLRT